VRLPQIGETITGGSYHSYWSSLEPAGYHDNNDQQQDHYLMDKELMEIKYFALEFVVPFVAKIFAWNV
jgi:hypothetical protein